MRLKKLHRKKGDTDLAWEAWVRGELSFILDPGGSVIVMTCRDTNGRLMDQWRERFVTINNSLNTKGGYLSFQLETRTANGKRKTQRVLVHRFVWMAFHNKPIIRGLDINHIDGNTMNNHPSNLELQTESANRGKRKMTPEEIQEIEDAYQDMGDWS